jgi:hypothetical protein
MILTRILPSVLKELLRHVPTVLFQVVDWNELVSELPKLSRRVIKKEGFETLFDEQKNFLGPSLLQLTLSPQNGYRVTKRSAETLLELYFTQLFSPHGLFLDLRSHHFGLNEEKLMWHPSGLWTKFDENFRMGLLDVYEGFYLHNDEKYLDGLKRIGLIAEDWSDEDKIRLSELFSAQFGSAKTESMSFNLEDFKNSILKTSNFMLSKKVNISKDFLYLGIYLVTMYAHLEQTSEKLAVREVYLAVRNKYST